ncbi:MAG: sugar phosphate isomerase/epimerase [Syntrophobacterales bacterium]|jgi:sugar phosphate isomerase/epimerase|nr:sugar phosphate isomerase/epimerase [Syntrophobacterales bacterium]
MAGNFFINIPYRKVRQNFKRVLSLGIGMEIYLENHLLEELVASEVRELRSNIEGNGLECTVHAPFMDLSPGGYDREVRRITREKLKKTVEIAALLRAKAVVCHPGYDKWRFNRNDKLWLDRSIETWTEVLREAEGGLMVLVENIFEEQPSTLIELFDHFREENLWFCFDSGHFNLFSTVSLDGWLTPLKGHIREMHLHDNHGGWDEHLPVGAGTFPFRELKAFLRGWSSDIMFTSEVHGEDRAEEGIKKLKEFLS